MCIRDRIYEDGLEQDVLLTKDMIGSYDMNKIGKQSIPISYCGLAETSLDILSLIHIYL